MTSNWKILLRFDDVSFAYADGKHPILKDASFSVRENTKITIMGQNGAWKSTMFKMILWEIEPQQGAVHIDKDASVAIARQVIPRDMMEMTVRDWFATAFKEQDYQLDMKIGKVLKEVNQVAPLDTPLNKFSGWQQSRLLLAYGLIQQPDILLLDEPTNNLDSAWIGDLISFLMWYDKTVIVISHDADFLNLFTDWVLYLNKDRLEVEQYWGDYYTVVDQIQARIEKEQKNNARMEKQIEKAKEKINQFSNKWWKMRKLAKKMRAEVEEAEENKVEVRKDDKVISTFKIPFENYVGPIVTINAISLMNREREIVNAELWVEVRKGQRYILEWPNGIGKTTLLKRLINAHDDDAMIHEEVRVAYYSQDFNALDMSIEVWDALHEVSNEVTDQEVFRVASMFLLRWWILKNTVGALSEWQKGLLCYARFVIQQPHLLILDEPTNHINFRHLPKIAEAINEYEGWIIMVSHDEAFVREINELEVIDLGKFI